jgi:probable phosphoglycerate mutase
LEPSTTHLIIVRHGETVWNADGRHQGHLDSELTERGLQQARALAERLAGERFIALYSSDLGRALKTAQVIGAQSSHTVLIDPRLRERNLGIFHGLTKEEMRERFPKEFEHYRSDPGYAIPQGESAQARMAEHIECLRYLAQKHLGERTVIVGHGGLLNSAFRHVLELPLSGNRQYSLANGSFNVISISANGKWQIETWGDVSHLRSLPTTDDLLY